jgi:NADH-quinone oxidoreductase subunit N
MWAPDAYEGSPLPITAWLSVGSKIAVMALIMRLFIVGFLPAPGGSEWQLVIILLSAATMVIGNLAALVQSNIKRLLAYSSVGHVGYLLMGVAAFIYVDDDGSSSLMSAHLISNALIFHVTAYAVTNLAAFMSITLVYNHTGRDDISGLAGLCRRQPLLALVLVSALFSLAGLPVFAGFTSKFYLFNAVGIQGLLWLVALGMVTSLMSLYYYLMVARQIYIEKSEDESSVPVTLFVKIVLCALLVAMVVGGVWPQPVMEVIQAATDSVMSADLIKHL